MTDWPDVLVAIDVGTSGARAVAFDLEGLRRLEVRRPYRTTFDHPGWAEQSALDWRRGALGALAELVVQLGPRRTVRGIGLTGQCPSVVLLDDRARPVRAGLTYRDNRATAEAVLIRERIGDAAIHARTGHLPELIPCRAEAALDQVHEQVFARTALSSSLATGSRSS